jgi:hypothetical protein
MTIPDETRPGESASGSHLRVVDERAKRPGDAATADRRRPRSFWVACLLGLVALGLCLWLASARARVRALEIENAALVSDLATTRTALEAHRARLAEVRDRVGEIRQRIGALGALLESEPSPPEAPPAER